MKTLDQRITDCPPGGTIRLGGDEHVWTTAERSGDGKTVRFIRHTPRGFEVFKTVTEGWR